MKPAKNRTLNNGRVTRAISIDTLETRVLFSGYAASFIASVPALASGAFNNASTDHPLVRDPATGLLYGYDPLGGENKTGIVYAVDPVAKTLTTLVTFAVAGPELPHQLVMDSQGNLFGYTAASAADGQAVYSGVGMLFEIAKTDQSTAIPLYTFSDSAQGTQPSAIVVEPDDDIDVLTTFGSTNNGGSILHFSKSDNYATASTLGAMPTNYQVYPDSLALAASGAFYGTTASGGANSNGSLFELPANSSTVSTLASFASATTGNGPQGVLAVDAQGRVTGTTPQGGSGGYGNVWQYDPSTQALTEIAPIPFGAGFYPEGGVIADSSGNLYGTVNQGQNNNGGFFKVDASTHAITFMSLTDTTLGSGPLAAPTPDGSGNFFIVTDVGAAGSRGAIVEISPSNGGGGGGSGTVALNPTVAKSTLPTAVVSGSTTRGAISVSITNSGSGASKGKGSVAIYASTTGVIDGSSMLLKTVTPNLSVKAGKTAKVNVPLSNISLPEGSYTLLAQTTDPAGNVTTSSAGPSLSVAAPFVQLMATLAPVTPAQIKIGKSGKLKLTLTNSGNIDTTGPATIDIGLSSDGTTLAIPLTTVSSKPKIKAGAVKAVNITLPIKIAKTFTATGVYFPLITFTQGSVTFTQAEMTSFSVV